MLCLQLISVEIVYQWQDWMDPGTTESYSRKHRKGTYQEDYCSAQYVCN